MKKLYFILLSILFVPVLSQAQVISDFMGQWNYEYSEVLIGEEWRTKTEVYDFDQQEDLNQEEISTELPQQELTPEAFFNIQSQETDLGLLLLDRTFTYRFSSKEKEFGKLNFYVKDSQNSITDYSSGYLRFSVFENKNLKIYNDESEEIYTITFYDQGELVLHNNTTNTKIHFKRI